MDTVTLVQLTPHLPGVLLWFIVFMSLWQTIEHITTGERSHAIRACAIFIASALLLVLTN